jgi:hypothetical protein
VRFRADLERIEQLLPAVKRDLSFLDQVQPDTYRLTLQHFEWALYSLETPEDKHARELTESLILPEPTPGVAYGLYTTSHSVGGIMAMQCSVRPFDRPLIWKWTCISFSSILAAFHNHPLTASTAFSARPNDLELQIGPARPMLLGQ